MRRVVGALVAVALLAVVPLTGCGIPGNTAVATHGAGPSPGIGGGVDTAPPHLPREATVDRAQFVANFLEAPAGESTQLVSTFLAPAIRDTFKSTTPEILVLHLTEPPLINPGNVEVVLRAQQVGVLGRDGVLDAPTTAQVLEYRLKVEEIEGGNGLYVTGAPSTLLTTDAALDKFYERRSIYFWSADHTRLVPDLRYMPKEVPVERQPNEIIDWLIAGPAPWLDGAVEPLPEGTKRPDNVPAASNGALQINLGGPVVQDGDQATVDRLSEQLRWSLQENLSHGQLELKIDQQLRGTYSGDAYLRSNPAWRAEAVPERFCVVAGQVRRMRTSLRPADPVPVITDVDNRDIRYAALVRAGVAGYAALVTEEGGTPYLRVGSAVSGRKAQFSHAPLPVPAGRPVWSAATAADDTRTGSAYGMVAAGGKLFGFTNEQPVPRAVEWQETPAGAITAVAAAPDGVRIAVIAGGQLYVAAVLPGPAGLRVGAPRPVGVQMRDLSAVDWSSESSVVVAGVRKDTARVALSDVSIDGVSQVYRLPDLGTFAVGYLAAFPANPVPGAGDAADAVAYVAENNAAYDALTSPQRIEADDVVGPLPSSGGTAPQPTAPFFLG